MKNFNEVLNDPSFVLGASILGNTGQPGVMGSAFQNMNNINKLKQESEQQKARMSLEEQNATDLRNYHQQDMELRKGEADATSAWRNQQAEMSKAQQARLEHQQAVQEAVMRALAPQLGFDPNAFGAGQPPQGSQQPQQQEPQPQQGGDPTSQPGGPQALPGPNGQTPMTPMIPELPGGAHIQPMPGFNPDAAGGPVGPRRGSGYSMHNAAAAVAPAIFGQESGNRDGVGTSVDGAVGPGQMLPATFQRFAKPGEEINNPADNRAVSMRYMDYLAAKAAGDPAKMAAGYFSGEGNMGTGAQPFKRDVADGNGKHVSSYVQDIMARLGPNAPTGYTARVLAGMDRPPAQASGMQGTPQPHQGLDMARAGAMMGLAGIPGGNSMVQLGQMMKPEQVAAGGYTRQPTGEMTFNGDPYKEHDMGVADQKLSLDQQRLQLEQRQADIAAQKTAAELQHAQQTAAEQGRKMTKEQAGDTLAYQGVTQKFSDVKALADNLLTKNADGLKYNSGYMGSAGLGNLIPSGRNAKADLDQMRSKIKIEVMGMLRSMSANGSTGFGAMNKEENQTAERYLANLDSAQDEKQLKEQIGKIKTWASGAQSRYAQQYKTIYGELPKEPEKPPEDKPTADAGGAMSLDAYIAKHKK